MTEKQKQFLIQEGFKERVDNLGGTEWYKHYQGNVEFVYTQGSILAHLLCEQWLSFLSTDAIALKLDYYSNKLNNVDML